VGGEKLEKSLGMKDIHQLGFVKLLDVMGNDEEVENSARISYGEGKSNAEPYPLPNETQTHLTL
jgi:hypothetical protein